VADAAAMNLGAASVSVYSTFTVEQAEHIVADAGIRVTPTMNLKRKPIADKYATEIKELYR
jgi:long-subunit acyl-CoA synthetase (AMP-forming)